MGFTCARAAIFLYLLSISKFSYALLSRSSCECQSECAAYLEIWGITFEQPSCTVDRSTCGCVEPHCTGFFNVYACPPFLSCGCYPGGSLYCTDECDAGTQTIGEAIGVITDRIVEIAEDAVDGFQELVTQTQSIIEAEIASLPVQIQYLLSPQNRTAFRLATIHQLFQIGQEVFSHLTNLAELVGPQIAQLVDRLVDFTLENLEAFLDRLNPQAWLDSIKAFGCVSDWTPQQFQALGTRVVGALGAVVGWTANDVRRVGSLVRGLSEGNLSTLRPLAYEASLLTISIATGGIPRSKLNALAQRAIQLYDTVSSWNATTWAKIGDVATGIAEGDLEEVSLTVLHEVARVKGWNASQEIALVEAVIGIVDGGLDNISSEDLQEVTQLSRGILVPRLQKLTSKTIWALGRGTCNITNICLSDAQTSAIVAAARDTLGEVATWNATDWRALGQNIRGLTAADVRSASLAGVAELCRVLDIDAETLDDTLKAAAVDRALTLLGDVGGWNAALVEQYAMLLPAMNASTLAGISLEGAMELGQLVLDHAPLPTGAIDVVVMGGQVTLSYQQQAAVVARVRSLTQSAGEWSPELARAMAGFADALSEQDLTALSPDALVTLAGSVALTATNDSTIADLIVQVEAQLGPVSTWSGETFGALRDVGARAVMLRLDVLLNSSTSSTPTAAITALSHVTGLSQANLLVIRNHIVSVYGALQSVPPELLDVRAITTALTQGDFETLGQIGLNALNTAGPGECPTRMPCNVDELGWTMPLSELAMCGRKLAAVVRRTTYFAGAVADWNVSTFASLGSLVTGITEADIGTLSEQAFDVLGNITCWDLDQLECLANRAIEVINFGRGLNSWATEKFDDLGEIVSGLPVEDLRTLNATTVARAASALGQSAWNSQQLLVLGDLATTTFGNASTWTTATVQAVGSMMAGLSDADLQLIPASALAEGLLVPTPAERQRRGLAAVRPRRLRSLHPVSILSRPTVRWTKRSRRSTPSPVAFNEQAVKMLCETRKVHVLTAAQLAEITRVGIPLNRTCPSETLIFTEAQESAAVSVRADQPPGGGNNNTPDSSSDSGGLSGGAVAAIVIVVLLAVGGAVAGVVIYRRRQDASTHAPISTMAPNKSVVGNPVFGGAPPTRPAPPSSSTVPPRAPPVAAPRPAPRPVKTPPPRPTRAPPPRRSGEESI
eukprot:m.1469220 g.1469220  ORF g.1469220 m.1469220 type:complete len:1185 (+) comp25140_c1_seq36:139-3693(+)